jgi:DNA-directed RNA polymerase specialized sigma24 family protein
MLWFWLGIARNILFNQIKKNGRINLVEDCTEFYGYHNHTQESILLQEEDDQHLENCLRRCGGRCYDILMMWVNNYPMEEIARRVNLSGPAMARKKKHQCLKKLKELLENGNTLHASIHIGKKHGAGGMGHGE